MSIFLFPNVGIIHHAEARDCSRHEILDYLLQPTNCVVSEQFDKDNCSTINNKMGDDVMGLCILMDTWVSIENNKDMYILTLG